MNTISNNVNRRFCARIISWNEHKGLEQILRVSKLVLYLVSRIKKIATVRKYGDSGLVLVHNECDVIQYSRPFFESF